MVKALHAAGIEVILDVVYNHTCEGNHLGPTLSLKGLDNRSYYRLVEESPRRYWDATGCGNSLDTTNPQTLKLVMDSLRYWVEEMHVDGFRFDLAVTLARDPELFDEASRFLVAVHQDPVLEKVKLIAEPWDLGPDGYKVGAFPVRWSEWNGKYRDVLRRFWKGDENQAGEMGYRLTGSADLYEPAGRKIYASVNFVTAHDGFTLRDLVSYERKHNEANLEENRDGADDNHSWNCGAEGETDDPEILALRERQMRNLMATLLVSQGMPMITAGDELGKTQAREQQRLLPRRRALLARLEPRRAPPHVPRLRATPDPAAPRAAGAPAAPLLPRRAPLGLVAEGPRLVPPRRHRDDRGGLAEAVREVGRVPARRRPDRDARRARGADRRRLAARAHERLERAGHLRPAGRRLGAGMGGARGHRRRAGGEARARRRARLGPARGAVARDPLAARRPLTIGARRARPAPRSRGGPRDPL